MSQPFEVNFDKAGRINHFVPAGHPDTTIAPGAMSDYLDGSEFIALKHGEYEIGEEGSLVHKAVEVPELVVVGAGVRIDRLTGFDVEEGDPAITIGALTRIDGTKISRGVTIGEHAVLLARSIGSNTTIGDHSRLRQGVEVGRNVVIGASVKIDEYSDISEEARILDGARLGYNTRVGQRAVILQRESIGPATGAKARTHDKGGEVVPAGVSVMNGRIIKPVPSGK